MFSANFKPKNNSCGNARFPCDSTAFLLSYILTLKFTKATEKSVILEKSDFLTQNFKISPRKDSPAHGFTHFCQVSRKSVKWKWPNGCAVGLFITKKVGILPLSLWLLKRSRQYFKVCPNPSSFRGDIQKRLPDSLQYRRRDSDKYFWCNSLFTVCQIVSDAVDEVILSLDVRIHRIHANIPCVKASKLISRACPRVNQRVGIRLAGTNLSWKQTHLLHCLL